MLVSIWSSPLISFIKDAYFLCKLFLETILGDILPIKSSLYGELCWLGYPTGGYASLKLLELLASF